jgi:hypothetical protein
VYVDTSPPKKTAADLAKRYDPITHELIDQQPLHVFATLMKLEMLAEAGSTCRYQ